MEIQMKILEWLAKIPLPRLALGTLLAILLLAAVEQMPFTQSVIEHLLNMENSR